MAGSSVAVPIYADLLSCHTSGVGLVRADQPAMPDRAIRTSIAASPPGDKVPPARGALCFPLLMPRLRGSERSASPLSRGRGGVLWLVLGLRLVCSKYFSSEAFSGLQLLLRLRLFRWLRFFAGSGPAFTPDGGSITQSFISRVASLLGIARGKGGASHVTCEWPPSARCCSRCARVRSLCSRMLDRFTMLSQGVAVMQV